MTVPQFPSDAERYEAIRRDTLAKLRPMRRDLVPLEGEALVNRLVEEALEAYYVDEIARGYAWDVIERLVRRTIADAAVG